MLLIRNIVNYSLAGKRSFWGTLIPSFNRVSKTRIGEVGPDRACAEWLMRNGAFVKWLGHPAYVDDYNKLPLDEKDKTRYYIEEIDAKDAAISHHGFPHFKSCEYIRKIRFQNCTYLNDECLEQLSILAHTLCDLEVVNCAEVTDKGIMSLQSLKKLEELKLGQFIKVKNLNKCIVDLRHLLPECNIVRVT